MKKIFTKILLFFIDKEILFEHFTSKQEFRGQTLLNKKLLDKISDLENFYKQKYDTVLKSLHGLNIFLQESYVPNSQFCLIQYTNLKGEPDVLITDLSKISQDEIQKILKVLQKSTNLTISRL